MRNSIHEETLERSPSSSTSLREVLLTGCSPSPIPVSDRPLSAEHIFAGHEVHGDEERPAVAKRIIFESIRQALKNELD